MRGGVVLKLVIFSLGFLVSSIALGAEALAGPVDDALPFLKSWPEFGKVLAFVIALQVALRGLAEGLTRISDYTDNAWDNKLAAILSETAWFLGTLLGKVGYGEPSLVTKEKFLDLSAKQAVEDAHKGD